MKDVASGPPLTPELLVRAYSAGIFPMAEDADDPEVFWVDPRRRGVLPLDGFHISRSLRRSILSGRWTWTADQAFEDVLDGCAARETTWMNWPIREAMLALHAAGIAHSQEVWIDGELAGGVYGVALGGAFFGESMFSARRDGSKVALAVLTRRLIDAGFVLFDTQFVTPHLLTLGAEEICRDDYRARLTQALSIRASLADAPLPDAQDVVQRRTQTS